MALKLNERYPGRFDNPSAGYPQGSFKNRTAPSAKDGSYLEKDWANDKEGFFQSLLASAVVQANGSVDKVGSSQYFNALLSIIGNVGVSWTNISGKPTTIAGYGITNAMAIGTGGIGAITSTPQLENAFAVPYGGMWSVNPSTQGVPFSYGSLIHAIYDANQSWTQIAADMTGGGIYWRGSINGSVQQFKKIWDSDNYNPALKITGDSCPTAGFYSGSKARPYMQHADATVVELPTLAQLVETNSAVAQRITGANCLQAGFVDGTANTPFMTHVNGTTVALARADSVVGVGQSWQDVTGSRAASTNYTNSTSKAISVSVTPGDSLRNELLIVVGGVEVSRMAIASGSVHQAIASVTAIVPSGATYSVSVGSGTISKWTELR